MAESAPDAQEEAQEERAEITTTAVVLHLGELPTTAGDAAVVTSDELLQFSNRAEVTLYILNEGETLIDPDGFKCEIDGATATVETGAKLSKGNQAKLRVEEVL